MCSLTIERVLLPMPDKVKDVVELDEKKMFAFSEDGLRIRAN